MGISSRPSSLRPILFLCYSVRNKVCHFHVASILELMNYRFLLRYRGIRFPFSLTKLTFILTTLCMHLPSIAWHIATTENWARQLIYRCKGKDAVGVVLQCSIYAFLGHWAVGIPLSLWRTASATPDLRLPSQSQSINALWPAPNYTAWWQRHMCEQLAQGRYVTWSEVTGTRTCDLLVYIYLYAQH